MAQRTIFMVRHGQHDRTTAPTDKSENGLTELGRRQATLTGQRLSEMHITSIYHSTLRRARETAEIIATNLPGVPLRASSVLCESIPAFPPAFIEWYSALSPEEVASETLQVAPEMRLWLGLWRRGTEWEVMKQDIVQSDKAFQKYFKPARGTDQCDVIVCHGNIIRYFMCRVLQVAPEAWVNSDIYNCGICEVTIKSGGKMQLISFNDSGHLPNSMRIFF